MNYISPIYLFADSQLLFWKRNDQLFLKSLLKYISSPKPYAAYIGASNGNQNVFFEIFKSAMNGIGIQNCRMIGLDFSSEDNKYLEKSNIILLAGGDVDEGWKIIQSNGLKESVLSQYRKGTVIIGISAGAVQLGLCGINFSLINQNSVSDYFHLIPHVIGVSEEEENWANLKALVIKKEGCCSGIGIPIGGGAIYYPDNTLEPIRKSIHEVTMNNGTPTCNLICANDKSIDIATVNIGHD